MLAKILAFVIFYFCIKVETQEYFNTWQVSLHENTLFRVANETLGRDLGIFFLYTYPDINEEDIIWSFIFKSSLYNILINDVLYNSSSAKSTLKDNVMTFTLQDGISWYFDFNYEFTLNGIHIISGNVTTKISITNLTVIRHFQDKQIFTEVDMNFGLPEIKINGGIFGIIFKGSIEDLIFEGMKAELYPLLKDLIIEILDDNEFLYQFTEFVIPSLGNEIGVISDMVGAKTTTEPSGQWQTFFMNGFVTMSNFCFCNADIKGKQPFIPIKSDTKNEYICLNLEVVTAALNAESLCGFRKDRVNFGEWNLKGTVGELFDIMPSLADYYSGSENYNIERDIAPNIAFDEKRDEAEVNKNFSFILDGKNTELLKFRGKYGIKVTAEIGGEMSSAILAKQADPQFKELYHENILDLLGLSNTKDMIFNELTSMKNNNILYEMPVPSSYTKSTLANKKNIKGYRYANAFCYEINVY